MNSNTAQLIIRKTGKLTETEMHDLIKKQESQWFQTEAQQRGNSINKTDEKSKPPDHITNFRKYKKQRDPKAVDTDINVLG